MINNTAIEVVLGLIFIFLLYSLLATVLMELIAKIFGLRARMLLKAVSKLLDDSNFEENNIVRRTTKSVLKENRFWQNFKDRQLTALFYAHPNIKNLGKNNFNRKPSDISAAMFCETFVQILRGNRFSGQQNQIDLIRENLKIGTPYEGNIGLPVFAIGDHAYKMKVLNNVSNTKIKPGKGKKTSQKLSINRQTMYQIKQMLFDSHSDIDWFKEKVKFWYNEMIERAQGWYIKQTRLILFFIGFVLAIIFNINAIVISQKLSSDKTTREVVLGMAKAYQPINATDIDKMSDDSFINEMKAVNKSIGKVNQVLGLGESLDDIENCRNHYLLGWLITGLAISLGAPFWFDLLKRIMAIREAGSKPTQKANKINNSDEIVG